MIFTKLLRILEAVGLGCVVVCEVTLGVMNYKKNQERSERAIAEQNKIMQDMADRVVKLFEGSKEQGAA